MVRAVAGMVSGDLGAARVAAVDAAGGCPVVQRARRLPPAADARPEPNVPLTQSSEPPRAERRPHRLTRPDGGSVEDPWYWLRDRDDPAVREHLEAENAYAATVMAHLEPLQERLFEEIRARVQETDASAPTLDGGWLYYRRTVEGQAYPVRCRRPAPAGIVRAGDLPAELRRPVDPESPPADEQVLYDQNAAAEGHEHHQLGAFAVSPDHRFLAVSADTTGAEVFEVRIHDLDTGDVLDDVVPRTGYGLAWASDATSFLYTVQDDAWRPHQVWRHRIGGPASEDELLLTEEDERFWIGVGRTRSGRFQVIVSASKVTTEAHLVDAEDPQATPRLVAEREYGVEYDLDHRGEQLYLLTNVDGAEDFKLCVAPVDAPQRANWRELVPHRPGVRLEDAEVFADTLVLAERRDARTTLRLCDPDTGVGRELPVDEEVSTVALGGNPRFETDTIRYVYTSLTTPVRAMEISLADGTQTLLKEQPVPGGYDRERYVSWRRWATAPDGTQVPISLVRRTDVPLDGTAPVLLYGYGAYELSMDPAFSPARLSLLDRGVVFAIAHVRGGGELGRGWYEDGKFAAKPNTFTDMIACAEDLIAAGVAAPDRLAIRGGSAGGMLIGAVLNLRPDLPAAAVAEVPFVDVITTMCDPSLPLTVIEYDEWGDPNDAAVLEVMRRYSPYDNVRDAAYPPLLVTAGLNDPRVQYWEPAKWVAKLRSVAGGGPFLLRTELGAGHGGPSGRYEAWRDEARVLSFLLDHLGVAEVEPA